MPSPRIALWRDRSIRFSMGAAGTASSVLFGVIRNKWLATHLQASGLGILGQVNSGQAWLGSLAGMGLSLPVARVVGASSGTADEELARRTVWTSLSLVGAGALLVATAGLLFAGPISAAILGTPAHAQLVRISMLGVSGIALQSVLLGLFAGRSDLKANLTLSLSGSLAALLVTLALVPRWGLAGAVLGGSVLWPVGIAAALLLHNRSYARIFAPIPRPFFNPALARSILAVGAAALTMSLVDIGTMLSVRVHYVRVNGFEANGLLQAALALSQMVGALFSGYLSNYAFGKVSATPNAAAIRAYTQRQWAPLMMFATLVVAVVMVASGPLLHLLYSSRFDPARPLMAWMLVGEFCRIGMNAWAVGALPVGGARLWAPIGLSTATGLAISYLFLSRAGVGTLSLPLSYVGAGLFSLLFAWITMARAGVGPSWRNAALVLSAAAGLAALAWWVTR